MECVENPPPVRRARDSFPRLRPSVRPPARPSVRPSVFPRPAFSALPHAQKHFPREGLLCRAPVTTCRATAAVPDGPHLAARPSHLLLFIPQRVIHVRQRAIRPVRERASGARKRTASRAPASRHARPGGHLGRPRTSARRPTHNRALGSPRTHFRRDGPAGTAIGPPDLHLAGRPAGKRARNLGIRSGRHVLNAAVCV